MGRITACAAIVIAMVAFALYGYNYSGTCARRIYLPPTRLRRRLTKMTPQKPSKRQTLPNSFGGKCHNIPSL